MMPFSTLSQQAVINVGSIFDWLWQAGLAKLWSACKPINAMLGLCALSALRATGLTLK
jgi:hypothetical protein